MGGSDKRRRSRQSLVRWTDEEFNAIATKADKAGLAVAAFMRAAALGDSGPRAQRRPPADHVALRQLLGHVGHIGNNINQIARALNTAEKAGFTGLSAALNACPAALSACDDIRRAILAALGKNPGPGP
jgi:Bacterial mobilisation protein (MobC)